MISKVLEKLSWLGHDAFLLSDGEKNIYFDPFRISPGNPPADVIFISHEHYDHCSPEDVEKIKKASTVIITDPQSAAKLKGDTRLVSPGDRLNVGDLEIEVVPAYNLNKKFHPKSLGGVGFIVRTSAVRIYHAGDTDYIPEMEKMNTDIALLPVSGTYVMTAEEAAQAALAIKPALAIPMHYASIVGSETDAQRFAELLKGKVDVKILPKR